METIVALATEPEARVAELLGRIPPRPGGLATRGGACAGGGGAWRRATSSNGKSCRRWRTSLASRISVWSGTSWSYVAPRSVWSPSSRGSKSASSKGVSIADLVSDPSVGRLAALLRGKAVSWSPLVPIQVAGSGTPSIAYTRRGAIACYGPLARALGSKRPFIGIQARGFDDEAACDVREGIEDLATVYLTAVRAGQPTGPYL